LERARPPLGKSKPNHRNQSNNTSIQTVGRSIDRSDDSLEEEEKEECHHTTHHHHPPEEYQEKPNNKCNALFAQRPNNVKQDTR
jgi:hypothetical protein